MTTFRALVDSLETLTPTGVIKHYISGPPAALNTADLPALWLELPRGDQRAARAGAEGGNRTISLDLVVALEPVAQSTAGANWDNAVDMLDSIATALIAYSSPFMGPMTWRSRLAILEVGRLAYWGVVTELSGMG